MWTDSNVRHGFAALVATGIFAVSATSVQGAVFTPLTARTGGWMAAGTRSVVDRLYLDADEDSSQSPVLVYKNGAHPVLIGQITDGISHPEGMSVDSQGDLFVANRYPGSVTAYRQGATSPYFTISKGLTSPNSVAIGNDGTLYVTQYAGDVRAYHPGAVRPFLRIPPIPVNPSGSSFYPTDVAVNGNGDLYVYYEETFYSEYIGEGIVIMYPAGQTVGTQLSFVHATNGGGIDLDHLGNIALAWAGSARSAGGIDVFTPGGQKLSSWDRQGEPTAMRLGRDEKLVYTSDVYLEIAAIYSYPDGHLMRRIQTPFHDSETLDVAVSPAHTH